MFTEIPKFFGKTFFIAYYLPSTILFVSTIGILFLFQCPIDMQRFLKVDLVSGVGFSAIIIWLCSVILLGLNYPIIRILEGYGTLNPFRLFIYLERYSFDKLKSSVDELDKKIKLNYESNEDIGDEVLSKWRFKKIKLLNEFPVDRSMLLPTRFGNTISSFESYPSNVYGLDAIQGWTRLLAVIPDSYKQAIDDEKSLMDFWVNIWFSSIILFSLYMGLSLYRQILPMPLIIVLLITVAFSSVHWAKVMAQGWGEMIKAAFDLYRIDLFEKLGFRIPATLDDEKKLWLYISQLMIYKDCESFDYLNSFRKIKDSNNSESVTRQSTHIP